MNEIHWDIGDLKPNIIRNYKLIINEPRIEPQSVRTKRVVQLNDKALSKSIE